MKSGCRIFFFLLVFALLPAATHAGHAGNAQSTLESFLEARRQGDHLASIRYLSESFLREFEKTNETSYLQFQRTNEEQYLDKDILKTELARESVFFWVDTEIRGTGYVISVKEKFELQIVTDKWQIVNWEILG